MLYAFHTSERQVKGHELVSKVVCDRICGYAILACGLDENIYLGLTRNTDDYREIVTRLWELLLSSMMQNIAIELPIEIPFQCVETEEQSEKLH